MAGKGMSAKPTGMKGFILTWVAQVFEPAMTSPGHWLSRLLGPIFGTGPGAGMSVIIVISGILIAGVGLGAYQNRQILHVGTLIPDLDAGR
jgi:hypothetical protein